MASIPAPFQRAQPIGGIGELHNLPAVYPKTCPARLYAQLPNKNAGQTIKDFLNINIGLALMRGHGFLSITSCIAMAAVSCPGGINGTSINPCA
jgi:hypothetical protein